MLGMVEELVSRVCDERIQQESFMRIISSLLGENRVLRDRLMFVESRLLSLELKQVQSECDSVKDDLHVSNEKLDYVLDLVSEMNDLKGYP